MSGVNWARRHKRDFGAVLTLEDPGTRFGLRFHRVPAPAQLILQFIDLDRAAPAPYDSDPRLRLATVEQVQLALDFARTHAEQDLLVHCVAGVSRSSAIALAIFADRLGAGNEDAALTQLLHIRSIAVPNLHVVQLADGLLDRDGRLLEVVQVWDTAISANVERRRLNRRAHFLFHNLPRAALRD